MKKIVGVFAAATMMFALPSVAMAAQFNSPSGTTVTAPGTNVSISVSGDVTSESGNGYISVEPGTTPAANVPAGVTPLATFEVVAEGDVQFSQISLTFSVGSRYAGAQATVYVVHSDGTQEAIPATVAADGTVTVTVDRLSVFSIVVDESTIPSGNQGGTGTTGGTTGTTGGTTTDTSATSPYTGAFLAPVAGMTVAAFAAAGGVSVVLRKKVNE